MSFVCSLNEVIGKSEAKVYVDLVLILCCNYNLQHRLTVQDNAKNLASMVSVFAHHTITAYMYQCIKY